MPAYAVYVLIAAMQVVSASLLSCAVDAAGKVAGDKIAGVHFALQARIRGFRGKIVRDARRKASDCCEVLHSFLLGPVLLAFSGCSPFTLAAAEGKQDIAFHPMLCVLPEHCS